MEQPASNDPAVGAPLRRAPILWSVNGCGLAAYGRRDVDPEAGTCVKTRCLILLFVPILALDSHRVHRAEGGWSFLERVPLSTLARAWNLAVIVVLAVGTGVGAYAAYTGTPAHRTRTRLAEAAARAARGEVAEAARLHGAVARDGPSVAEQGWTALAGLLATGLDSASADEVAGALEATVDLLRSARSSRDLDVIGCAVAQARSRSASDPDGALRILDSVERAVGPDHRSAWLAATMPPLQHLVRMRPDDVPLLSRLAEAHEAAGDLQQARHILQPHAARLGASEGARVLGQALAAEGKLDEAHALLEPYVASRLPRLRAAEEDWDRCAEAAWDAAIHALDAGEAPRSWYAAYDRGGEAERERLINAWVQERMERDPVVARARDRHIAAAAVVEVALDLGLLQVQRARQMDDDAARQRQMSAAEQTFLAIRGSAGDTDAYRLALGQAYCWMGRHEEGRAHLDALLEEHQRSAASLLMVGEILREVGAHGEAGAVFEESYAQARSDEERYEAAAARALTAEDPDEELGWLRRADPASPFVRAGVSSALADQSMRQGDEAAAEHHLRQAIGLYAQMPETTSSLNNGALLWMRLHRVTGEPAALEQAAAMVERAVALEPDDSILAHNASEMLLHAAVASLIAGRIEPERVGRGPDLDLLDALYLDQGERGRIAAELAAQPRFTRAMGYAERAILLAPRSAQVRRTLFGARNLLRDEEGVRRLLESTRGVELDLAAEAAALASHLAGEDDQRHRVAAGARTVECRAALDSGVSGPMRALALMGILDSTLTLAALGDAVDPDEVVAMAQAAHEAAPSGDTHAMLLTAHLLRANAELAAAHPEFAALHRAGLRLLPEVHALILGLERCGDLQPAAAAHPDVRRALAIAREQAEAFPGDPAPWMWALWRPFDPAQAEAHAQRVRRDTFGAQRRELRLLLWPGNAWSVYEAAWERLILGDQAGAAAILERCRAQGVPLP